MCGRASARARCFADGMNAVVTREEMPNPNACIRPIFMQ
jgi:hypothetical protein